MRDLNTTYRNVYSIADLHKKSINFLLNSQPILMLFPYVCTLGAFMDAVDTGDGTVDLFLQRRGSPIVNQYVHNGDKCVSRAKESYWRDL